jgi:hypothetical protein
VDVLYGFLILVEFGHRENIGGIELHTWYAV